MKSYADIDKLRWYIRSRSGPIFMPALLAQHTVESNNIINRMRTLISLFITSQNIVYVN